MKIVNALAAWSLAGRAWVGLTALLLISAALGIARIFTESNISAKVGNGVLLALFVLFLTIIIDGVRVARVRLSCTRTLPHYFSLNQSHVAALAIENQSSLPVVVAIWDGAPAQFISSEFPMTQPIAAQSKAEYNYELKAIARGRAYFELCYLTVQSDWGLINQRRRIALANEVKIYPDFTSLTASMQLGMERMLFGLGANISQRRGEGIEFNQLRDFRLGDSLKTVDWKATARLNKPITREFQEEKDQQIIFMLDSSRRMRAIDSGLSYFDAALNAVLMCSYVALDRGDAVGVGCFGNQDSWLAPVKGKLSVTQILNHLFDLDTSNRSCDYHEAAERVVENQRKRALIVLITNIREEDALDLERAIALLRNKHLVMVVALQEPAIAMAKTSTDNKIDDLVAYAYATGIQHRRDLLLRKLQKSGISVLDSNGKDMHIQLISEYLRLKRMGKI